MAKQSRIFEDQISQKVNGIANIPAAIHDLIFGRYLTHCLCARHNHLKPEYLLGIKAGPTPADEFASFLHLCQAGLVVACVLGLVACLALAYLCLVK